MKKKDVTIILAISLFMIGCVTSSSISDSYDQFLIINQKFKLSSRSCKIVVIDSIDENYLYLISFNSVRGGNNYLFGKKIKEVDGNKEKRLNVLSPQNGTHMFSINDFKIFNMDTIDLNSHLKY